MGAPDLASNGGSDLARTDDLAATYTSGLLHWGTDLPNPGPITSGNTTPYLFGSVVYAGTANPISCSFSVTLSSVSGSLTLSQWADAIALADQNGVPLSQAPIQLQPQQLFHVRAAVRVPANAKLKDSVTFTIIATWADNPAFVWSANPVEIQVGERSTLSAPDLLFGNETPPWPSALNPARLVVDPFDHLPYIEVPFKKSGQPASLASIRLALRAQNGGQWTYSETISPATDWSTPPCSPSSSAGPIPAGASPETVTVPLSLLAEAPSDGSHPEKAVLIFSATPVGGATASSFMTMNIRGY
jgi:hypothetical protein